MYVYIYYINIEMCVCVDVYIYIEREKDVCVCAYCNVSPTLYFPFSTWSDVSGFDDSIYSGEKHRN